MFPRQLSLMDPRPTALVILNSEHAVQICKVLGHAGVRIPQDLAVVGYDYLAWADSATVPLTTVEQPLEELASRTVEITRRRLVEPDSPRMQIELPHRLMVRGSCGAGRTVAAGA
jgi:LacI family transcriptional regulator